MRFLKAPSELAVPLSSSRSFLITVLFSSQLLALSLIRKWFLLLLFQNTAGDLPLAFPGISQRGEVSLLWYVKPKPRAQISSLWGSLCVLVSAKWDWVYLISFLIPTTNLAKASKSGVPEEVLK